ncbi:MAG TPA: Crp/Fnr family transcriptional regulator [Gemmatimonadaceae bacterium]|nr:Crp/Fnr family transcriptional regulator [Gemmatimonadaceae bacterium]
MTAPAASGAAPRNRILAALPADEYARLAPRLELVPLELRHLVFDVDQPIEHVYFPEAGVVSIVSVMADGTAAETATVGYEGMVGLPVFLGTDRTASQAFCQVRGEAYRLTTPAFLQAVGESATLRAVLGRYAQALFTLVAQSSACNRLHPMRQRCARWLLMTHDRVGTATFALTQQFLSQMLGVRRATVTEAAGELQAAGLIEYAYGKITVRDRPGLERAACECYAITQREFARLLEGRSLPGPLTGVRLSEGGLSAVGDGTPREDVMSAPRDDGGNTSLERR